MQQSLRTIGLFSAILININVIVGSGIFINVYPLMQGGGTGSFITYLLAALFLLPVVMVLAVLAVQQPESGGLYVYTRTYLHPFVGFLCGWGYFLGKSISVGLMANVMVAVFERMFPVLLAVPHIVLVVLLLTVLALLNIVGASIQGGAQRVFILAKVVPVLSVLLLLAWYGAAVPISFEHVSVGSLSGIVPIAVFAMVGFEVTCTIAHFFINPSYTIPRAALGGFVIVAAILAAFQYALGALLPVSLLQSLPGLPAAALSAVAGMYVPSVVLFSQLLTACVYISILGGAFGVLTSNCWNLHRLAAQGHVPGARWLTRLTAGQVPWVSLLVEVVIAVLSVAITTNQVPLQKMSILSVIFAFCCAMLAAVFARNTAGTYLVNRFLVIAGLMSTLTLFGITLHQVFLHGLSLPYALLFGAGVVSAVYYGLQEKY
jgi:amino acid transporter